MPSHSDRWKDSGLSSGSRIYRIGELKAEFQRLIDFHEESFREIDAKAKYWLTAALPSFIGLAGYLFEKGSSLSLPLLVGSSALAACLIISVYLFSSVLLSRRVESGILIPTSGKLEDASYFLEGDDRWAELYEDQANELLRAISNNQTQNAHKSKRLRRAEVSLFRGAPAAVCLAGGSAFAYTAACPIGLVATGVGAITAGTAAGIAIGAGTAAALIAFDHFVTLKRKARKV